MLKASLYSAWGSSLDTRETFPEQVKVKLLLSGSDAKAKLGNVHQ